MLRLSKINTILPSGSAGLYRDDGLAALIGRGRFVDGMRKKLLEMFRSEGLSITAETNVTVVDFLDVVLNLNDGTYHPFIKPNSSTKYVSADSSHPPRVLKNLSSGISKRLSMVSSNKQMFDSEAPYYQEALRNAGFKEDLMYWEESEPRAPEERKSRKKNKGRKVLWYKTSKIEGNVSKK